MKCQKVFFTNKRPKHGALRLKTCFLFFVEPPAELPVERGASSFCYCHIIFSTSEFVRRAAVSSCEAAGWRFVMTDCFSLRPSSSSWGWWSRSCWTVVDQTPSVWPHGVPQPVIFLNGAPAFKHTRPQSLFNAHKEANSWDERWPRPGEPDLFFKDRYLRRQTHLSSCESWLITNSTWRSIFRGERPHEELINQQAAKFSLTDPGPQWL